MQSGVHSMKISQGKINGPLKIVVYGPEGIGKSTFASKFPDPLFIDTEGSTKHLDVKRFDNTSSYSMLIEQIKYVLANPSCCKTLVIDTIDWAEQMCIKSFCEAKQIKGIEDMSYGKGYVYIAEEFGRMLNLLQEVILKGINVVVTAHAQMRKFEQPDELGAYDRWELKLQKKDSPLIKEWADMILFANYKTIVVNVDNQGATKGKNKAQGGKRVMYTTHHPCWDAKNRFNLPDELPFDFKSIENIINLNKIEKVAADGNLDLYEKKKDIYESESQEITSDQYIGVPNELIDLMNTCVPKITLEDIQKEVGAIGYFPPDMPVKDYPKDFINFLISEWPNVKQSIITRKAGN